MGGTAGAEPVAMTKRRALMRVSPASHGVARDELGGGAYHLDAEAGEALRGVVGGDRGDDAVDVVVHALVAHRRVGRHDAERRAGAHQVGPAGRRDQGLGGHAAVVEAVAAHLVLLDQRHRHAELGGRSRHREAAGACADHADVDAQLPAAGDLDRLGPDGHRHCPPAAAADPHQAHRPVIWLLHACFSISCNATGISATMPSSTSASTSSLVTSERAWMPSLHTSALLRATHCA